MSDGPDPADAVVVFASIALMAYRSDDPTPYLDALEEAAAELEAAWLLEPGWAERIQVIRIPNDGPPS